jgi:hypothetical protein
MLVVGLTLDDDPFLDAVVLARAVTVARVIAAVGGVPQDELDRAELPPLVFAVSTTLSLAASFGSSGLRSKTWVFGVFWLSGLP